MMRCQVSSVCPPQPRARVHVCLVFLLIGCSTGGSSSAPAAIDLVVEDNLDTPDDPSSQDAPQDEPEEAGDPGAEGDGLPSDGAPGDQDIELEETDRAQDIPDTSPEDAQVGQPCEQYGPVEVLGTVTTDRVDEASGLAVSLNNPGVLWTHNDSGGTAELFAMTLDGSLLGAVRLVDAQAHDWEDVALGPCDQVECLYVGDIGNNSLHRTDLALVRVPEPAVTTDQPFDVLEVTTWQRFPFQYPSGNFDAESLMVDTRGTPYLLTKVTNGASRLYRFPELAGEGVLTLVEVGLVPVGDDAVSLATGADLDRSGTRLIVRTYVTAWEWRFAPADSVESVVGTVGTEVPVHFEVLGEAIAYDPIGGGYLHLGEGLNPDIYRVGCRR